MSEECEEDEEINDDYNSRSEYGAREAIHAVKVSAKMKTV